MKQSLLRYANQVAMAFTKIILVQNVHFSLILSLKKTRKVEEYEMQVRKKQVLTALSMKLHELKDLFISTKEM